MAVGSANVTTDIMTESVETKPTETGLTVDLQFLPDDVTILCLDFNVEDDELIEDTEHFQGSLQPALTEFDKAIMNKTSVYIADNDGKFQPIQLTGNSSNTTH